MQLASERPIFSCGKDDKFITTGKTSAVGGRNVSKTTTFSFRVVKPVDEGTLSLSKTSTNMKQNQTVEAGETVKYKIVVLAKGKAVPNINIEDTLPTGLKLTGNISSKHTGKSSSGGTISISTSTKSNTLTMNVFSGLAAGAKVEFTYSCKVSQSTTTTALKNTAKAVGGTYADRTASASFSVIVQGTPPMPFSDVLTNAWYSDAVMWAWQNNFITGYAGTSLFGPNDRLTRGQAAVILWRRYGGTTAKNYNASSSKNSTPFSDNANGQYYTEAINWAYKNRIMTGYSGKKIVGVYDTITRQQMCVIMYRCAVNLSHQSSSYSEIKYNSYPDRTNVALYAKAAVAWCVDKGVISGWDNKYLMPQMTVDRAQMGQIMMNSYEKKLIWAFWRTALLQ